MKYFILTLVSFFVLMSVVQAESEATLPVKRIILSTSGIAHFEHEGEVTDDAEITLSARLDQVDDLLKSLIVFDSGGELGGISLPGRAPLTQIFRDFPFSQHEINSPVALLNALQGASVTIKGLTETSGKIVQVVPETITLDNGQQITTRHRLSLMGEDGLKQMVLEDINTVHFNDVKLRDQVDRALNVIHEHAVRDSRTLTIDLRGEGTRTATLGYVVEAPLWKATYRLMLPRDEKETGFVQGWAIIENMTGNDWDDVALTLVSGNPVTFRQALYQSYNVSRPTMPVEVLGRVLPRADTGAMGAASNLEGDAAETLSKRMAPQSLKQSKARVAAEVSLAEENIFPEMLDSVASSMPARSDLQFAQTQATISEEATTQVLFRFPDKFDLIAGHSLVLPFVSRELPIERLWLYQPETHATHPLATLRIKNDGRSGLPPGIITLYEQDTQNGANYFVGDAKFPVLSKGEERLVSYALDTKTLINKQDKNTVHQGAITISGGVMVTATKYLSETKYTLKAPAEEKRLVMLEHPRQPNYKLAMPGSEEVEATKTHYRIRQLLNPGESKTLKVVLEHDSQKSMRIMDLSYKQLGAYAASTGELEPRVRELFESMAKMRLAVNKFDTEIRRLNDNRQSTFDDQKRIRENLKSVPNNSDIAQRYLKRLGEQENKLDEIALRYAEFEQERNVQLRKLEEFISDIKI